MKINFQFSNLFGTVYKKGNLLFSNNGHNLLSPVGNKVTSYDLHNDCSQTLPFNSSYDITHIAVSPTAALLIAINEEGEAYLCSLSTGAVICQHHFHCPVTALSFSPDGKMFAVAKSNLVLVYFAPGMDRQFNQFLLHRVFYGASDDVMWIDWTTDSKAFLAGGKDSNSRVYAANKSSNLVVYSLGGHSDAVIGCFFARSSLDVYSISENGQVCHWECDTPLDGLLPWVEKVAVEEEEGSDEEEGQRSIKRMRTDQEEAEKILDQAKSKILYKKIKRFHYCDTATEERLKSRVTSVNFHKATDLLISGLSDGSFILHMMPDFTPVHSLNISDSSVTSVCFNKSGNWAAIGCAERGQLVVWEWQSKSFIRKAESHFNGMTCLSFSPDGRLMASGGVDAKVKLWQVRSGTSFVTFKEHTAGVTAIAFPVLKPQMLVSASLDGTVRAFDLHRYRNFRTLTTPRPSQFSCVTIEAQGDLVAAGCITTFEAHVWSVQTRQLLVSLAGHTGPISGLHFSPSTSSAQLATASWDGNLRLWDFLDSRDAKDVITLNSDALAVAYRPDGKQVAVALLNSHILFFDAITADQVFSIEGHHDLGYTKPEGEKISSKKASESKCFQSISYSADGRFLLAAGNSKFICLYSVEDQFLVKRFEVTCNQSLDGVQEMHDRRKMTEWGSMDLIDIGQGGDGKKVALPGVRSGEFSRRHWRPEVRVSNIQFSPSGQSFAATTTEGLLVYSVESGLVFDPSGVDETVTPDNIRSLVAGGESGPALEMALRLGQSSLIEEVIETISVRQVDYLSRHLSMETALALIRFLSHQLENSRHLEFYLTWMDCLLFVLAPRLRQERSMEWQAALVHLERPFRKAKEHFNSRADWIVNHTAYLSVLNKIEKVVSPESSL